MSPAINWVGKWFGVRWLDTARQAFNIWFRLTPLGCYEYGN